MQSEQTKDRNQDGKPGNLREQAYGSFTQHLLARDLRPGQFVSQRELVELTGLPLGAIRELIPRLEAEGLIQTVPKRGMQIAHVDLNLIRDAFEFRIFMEVEAAAMFARNGTTEQFAELRDAHQKVLNSCADNQLSPAEQDQLIENAQATDWHLHMTIIDALRNRILTDAYRVNSIKIRLIKQEQTSLNMNVLVPTMQEHMAIIEAFEKRDGDAAAAAMRKHIINARNRALDQR